MASQDGKAQAGAEYQAALAEYHASRARYIRTVTADAEKKLYEQVQKRRDSLKEEINNLGALAKLRYDTRQATVRAYGAKAPGKVGAAGLQPPGAADKLFSGLDKLYRAAVKAADEFNEVNEILKKRRESLESIDRELRELLKQHTEGLIKQLETPNGLETAFRRDPLLGRAHARMVAAKQAAGIAESAGGGAAQ